NLTVGSNVSAWHLHTRGAINLRGARIPGKLDLLGARLTNPDGTALRASSCVIGEVWLRDAAPIEGSVSLRRSQLELLYATPGVRPPCANPDGLTYGPPPPRLPAGRRLELLEREEDGYVPHAYEQLAAAYRRIGDDTGTRTVQLAKQRR